jgi:phosphoribosylamine--glycine ligase
VIAFHAGTTRDVQGVLRVSGGRVFAVTGLGSTFEEAQARSRAGAEAISYQGKVYRGDIGWREADRQGA